jgi:hypothetical protein
MRREWREKETGYARSSVNTRIYTLDTIKLCIVSEVVFF